MRTQLDGWWLGWSIGWLVVCFSPLRRSNGVVITAACGEKKNEGLLMGPLLVPGWWTLRTSQAKASVDCDKVGKHSSSLMNLFRDFTKVNIFCSEFRLVEFQFNLLMFNVSKQGTFNKDIRVCIDDTLKAAHITHKVLVFINNVIHP